jgi:dihydrofolate synthase / folylpolyglutamate synthase
MTSLTESLRLSDSPALSDPLAWLFGLEQFGIKLGLDNITAILDALGHPERAFRSVHIAGTNGKGSVTAMVDAALRAAGHRSARYTSPHLIDLAERFVVDGRPVAPETLGHAVRDVRDVVDLLCRRGRLRVQPTFFEVTTAVGFELFRRAGAEVAVCEVGLGGRLDATNVIDPVASAITSIGFDHQQYLGRTLPDIAGEKAGIIKPGVPVVVGRLDRQAFDAVAEVARRQGAELIEALAGVSVEEIRMDDVRVTRDGAGTSLDSPTRLRLRTPRRDYGRVELALRGSHQIDNALVAVRLLETIDERGVTVQPVAVVEGLQRAAWPGRLDVRSGPGGREALLDAAHNGDGAAALAAFLRTSGFGKAPLVFAAMRDKDIDAMLRALAPEIGALVPTRASNARSADPWEIARLARAIAPGLPITLAAEPAEALESAWRLSARIVVAGSIFLIGDVMKQSGWS